MYRLLNRIYLDTREPGELTATLEREIEAPFVPQEGMRLDFSSEPIDVSDLVLGQPVWIAKHGRFEFATAEEAPSKLVVVVLMDERTKAGFRVVACSDEQAWDEFRGGKRAATGAMVGIGGASICPA